MSEIRARVIKAACEAHAEAQRQRLPDVACARAREYASAREALTIAAEEIHRAGGQRQVVIEGLLRELTDGNA